MKKSTILPAAIFAVVGLIAIGLTQYVKSQDDFKVVYFDEVKSEVGPDGRAAVGSPAVYQVQISPALCWEKGDNHVKLWRNIGMIVLLLSAVYIALADRGTITGSIHYAYAGLAIAAACYFGAYSSSYSNNYKEISPQEYHQIKDDPAALEALFDKPLIK